jgi:hypothetical protein
MASPSGGIRAGKRTTLKDDDLSIDQSGGDLGFVTHKVGDEGASPA